MEKLTFIASCALASHYALFFYSLLTHTVELTLYSMIFGFGIVSIVFFSLTREVYENTMYFTNTVFVGLSTFFTSLYLSSIYSFAKPIFTWAIAIAFNYGGLRSMRLVETSNIVKRGIVYNTLTLILNIIYIVL